MPKKLKTIGDVWNKDSPINRGMPTDFNRKSAWDFSYSFFGGGENFPERKVFNQLFYELYSLFSELLSHGLLQWDANVSYPDDALVIGSNGKLYNRIKGTGNSTTNETTGNTTDPTNDNVNWKTFVGNLPGDATVTEKGIVLLPTNNEINQGSGNKIAVPSVKTRFDSYNTSISASISNLALAKVWVSNWIDGGSFMQPLSNSTANSNPETIGVQINPKTLTHNLNSQDIQIFILARNREAGDQKFTVIQSGYIYGQETAEPPNRLVDIYANNLYYYYWGFDISIIDSLPANSIFPISFTNPPAFKYRRGWSFAIQARNNFYDSNGENGSSINLGTSFGGHDNTRYYRLGNELSPGNDPGLTLRIRDNNSVDIIPNPIRVFKPSGAWDYNGFGILGFIVQSGIQLENDLDLGNPDSIGSQYYTTNICDNTSQDDGPFVIPVPIPNLTAKTTLDYCDRGSIFTALKLADLDVKFVVTKAPT